MPPKIDLLNYLSLSIPLFSSKQNEDTLLRVLFRGEKRIPYFFVIFFIIIYLSLAIFRVNSPILPIMLYVVVPHLFPRTNNQYQLFPKNN